MKKNTDKKGSESEFDIINNDNSDMEFLSQQDLIRILPFGRRKTLSLCQQHILPVVKVGRDYITTAKALEDWISENIGNDIDNYI